jgi:hypothetical protein
MATKKEIGDYLERLRQSGKTNMYGATPYLMKEFNLSRQDAMKELSYWMKNYGKEEE